VTGVPLVLQAGGQTWRASPERLSTIGRATEADVRLDDPRISRHRATLEFTPQGWVLVSHGSNGMFVDGQRVERLAVQHPVTVSLGAQTEGVIMQLHPEPVAAPDAATQVAVVRPAQPSQLPPANWYPDPAGSHRLRYFNGSDWTDEYYGPPAERLPPGYAVGSHGYPAAAPGYSTPPVGSPSPAGQPSAQPRPGDARTFQIRLRRHTGLVILMLRQSFVFTGTLEECERAYRQAQIYNLTAGWYPDPSGAPGQRYWDGTVWRR